MIDHFVTGATYTSKGMIFVVLSIHPGDFQGELIAYCLLLDDNPKLKFSKLIPVGTVMGVDSWSSVWEEATQIASLP
jgi:hypothetical protein